MLTEQSQCHFPHVSFKTICLFSLFTQFCCAGRETHRPGSSCAASTSASAATTIQKGWRGHAARSNDKRVNELKEEVRQLRHEQHIRHLSKELDVTKSALEQERKLRALQMDAIKVLWKEVQLMDNPNARARTVPSGQAGSKISSRSSENSIAKLMETLEATAGSTSYLST